MPDIPDIRAAGDTALRAIDGLQVGNHLDSGTPGVKAMWVFPELTYRLTMGDSGYWGGPEGIAAVLVLTVPAILLHEAVALIDEYRSFSGTKSIRAALEVEDSDGNKSLGGVVDDMFVEKSRFVPFEDPAPNGPFFGAEFDVRILALKG